MYVAAYVAVAPSGLVAVRLRTEERELCGSG
jgi:hypothetical protein